MATPLYLPAPRASSRAPTTTDVVVSKQNGSNSKSIVNNRSSTTINPTTSTPVAPSYEQRCAVAAEWRASGGSSNSSKKANKTKPFVPRSVSDFDDGGAFPEIHVAQYPLHMGNPHLRGASSSSSLSSSRGVRAVEVDASGKVSYDALVKGSLDESNSKAVVFTRRSDLRGGPADPDAVRPSTDAEKAACAASTAAALAAVLSSTEEATRPITSKSSTAATSELLRYNPHKDAPGYSVSQRLVQMVPLQVDPMMPPKHRHRKAPRGPAEDPVPVLHAPPQRLTKEEREAWNVPACISNWKNTRGYTIPLDKRLAADGRGLLETEINPNFATLAESLQVAEKQAREEVKARARVQAQLASAAVEKRENDLRDLAAAARRERSGGVGVRTTVASEEPVTSTTEEPNEHHHDDDPRPVPRVVERDDDDDVHDEDRSRRSGSDRRSIDHDHDNDKNNVKDDNYEDVSAEAQRDRLRIARKKQRERELRLENRRHPNDDNDNDNDEENAEKRRRLEDDRDVSEKIALGVHTGNGGADQGVDARLYHRSGGLDSGYGPDDEYNAYSKPLFDRAAVARSIYRPSADAAHDADAQLEALRGNAARTFVPDRAFQGGDTGGTAATRTGPVQFEKGRPSSQP